MSEPFNCDKISLDNWEGFVPVRKKPVIVHACQMNLPEGFTVTTLEGVHRGHPGDYLMIGIEGEKYPCKKEIFEKTYDVVGPCKEEILEKTCDVDESTNKKQLAAEIRLFLEAYGRHVDEEVPDEWLTTDAAEMEMAARALERGEVYVPNSVWDSGGYKPGGRDLHSHLKERILQLEEPKHSSGQQS